jgi:hypothetical protein
LPTVTVTRRRSPRIANLTLLTDNRC